jgi:hypothetical protein
MFPSGKTDCALAAAGRSRATRRHSNALFSAVMTPEQVQAAAMRLPGVSESTSGGTLSFTVRKRLFLRVKDRGSTLVLRTDPYERAHLLSTQPSVFFIGERIREHPWVYVRLEAADAEQIAALVPDAWRRVAPASLVRALDGE